jgi:hypothetical protein
MAEILARTDLSAQKKLNLLSVQHSRFDKIMKNIGVLSGGPAPAVATKAYPPKDQAKEIEEQENDEKADKLQETPSLNLHLFQLPR